MLSSLGQDLRYGLRTLARAPAFTAIAVLAIALGIGANTAMFTIVNTVLLRPLPYPEPDRLILLSERNLSLGFPQFSFSPANLLDYRAQNHTFADISALRGESLTYTGGGDAEVIRSFGVSENFFHVVGIQPALGREFTPKDAQPGAPKVVVISHAFWQNRLGGNPAVLQQPIKLSNEVWTICGVMPRGFEFPTNVEMWWPLQMDTKESQRRGAHYLGAIGRLKPGVELQQAATDLNTVAARLQKQYSGTNTGWDTTMATLPERTVGEIRPAILTLLAAVSFVLLIACANLANLLLSKSSVRRREISIRGTLGAGKARLVQQLLTESMALSIAGGVVGLCVGYFGIQAFLHANPGVVPRAKYIGFDWRVLTFTGAASMLTAALFGLAPALQLTGCDLNSGLRDGGRGSSVGFRRNKLRSTLLIGEIALSMILLAGAGLLMRSFYQLSQVDPGFDSGHLITMRVNLDRKHYSESAKLASFYREVLGKVRGLPGVQHAGATLTFPLADGNNFLAFSLPTHPAKPAGQQDSAAFYAVTPEYFEAMKIPLKAGRYLWERDREGGTKVAVVSEEWVKKYMPGENPIGKPLTIGSANAKPSEIVGVVGDVHDGGLDSKTRPTMYSPAYQANWTSLTLVTRTAQPPTTLVRSIRDAVRAVDAEAPVDRISTGDEVMVKALASPRLAMVLMATFAVLALVLAAIGIYGVVSYSVVQATREIGVRIALGAQRQDVMKLVLGYGGIVGAAGLLIGVPAALALTRLIATQLFNVKPHDPATFTAVAVGLFAITLLACVVPTYRAMRVDPNVALRYE